MAHRLYLIEDNPDITEPLVDFLGSWQGFEILARSDGDSLFTDLSQFEPDVLILDLQLQQDREAGFKILEALRKSAWSRMPVVIFSVFCFPQERQRASELGVNYFVAKPASLARLEQTVRKVLGLTE